MSFCVLIRLRRASPERAMGRLFLLTKAVLLTALVQTRTASASGEGTADVRNPITVPLFATGALYETFQMTVGLGTPNRDFNLTLASFTLRDTILSASLVHNEGSCFMKNLNRSALYNPSLSSDFRWGDMASSGEQTNPFWQTSPCGFHTHIVSFSDDVRVGSVPVNADVSLNLVDNINGTFLDGWHEAGFVTLQHWGIITWALESPNSVITIRLYSVDGSSSHGALMLGESGGTFCERSTFFVGALNSGNKPSLTVDSVRIGNAVMPVGTTALLALEHSISRIDQASLDEIANLTDATFNSSTALYYVDCSKTDTLPDMFFKMVSFEYYLSSEFYTRQVSPDECVLMFAGNNRNDIDSAWLLGTSFLKPYCLLVDYERQTVSFARIPGITYKEPFTTSTVPSISQSLSTGAIVAIAVSSVLAGGVASGLVLFFCLRRKILNQRIVTALPGTRYYYFKRFLSAKTAEDGLECDEYELKPTDIRISDSLLGEGAYGKVYKGTFTASRRNVSGKVALAIELTDEIAVKVLHSHASDQTRAEFRREIDLLREVGHHPHILNIIGCVTHTRELVLVAEFCANGDLLAVIRRHRSCVLSDSDLCQVEEDMCAVRKSLISFAWQVCDGMVFLASKKLVHRDLAARNVLLTSKMVAKIADFGMCIRAEEATVTESNKVPVRWTAPEALRSGQFSVASDVWSYGVLLYELFAGGDMPYQDIELEELLNYLEEGGRLKQPESCPDEIYCIMEKCWTESPAQRPSFEHVRSSVASVLEHSSYVYGYLNATEHYRRPATETASS